MRRDLYVALDDIRTQLAEFVNCDKDELALVTNTTVGINTVLRSLPFVPGDRILVLSTGYVSVNQTVRYICDTHQDVKVIEVPVTFPISDKDLLVKVEDALKAHQELKDGSRIKLGIVDWISSVPSVVHPVKELVELLHSYGALVYVDGAHSIGQVPVDLSYLRPDFYITNCHKVRLETSLKRCFSLTCSSSIASDVLTIPNLFSTVAVQCPWISSVICRQAPPTPNPSNVHHRRLHFRFRKGIWLGRHPGLLLPYVHPLRLKVP